MGYFPATRRPHKTTANGKGDSFSSLCSCSVLPHDQTIQNRVVHRARFHQFRPSKHAYGKEGDDGVGSGKGDRTGKTFYATTNLITNPSRATKSWPRPSSTPTRQKVAAIGEKDAVVRAAALLAERNDELVSQVGRGLEEINALVTAQKALEDDHRERMEGAAASAAAAMDEMEKKVGEERAEHEKKLKEAAEKADVIVKEIERAMSDERDDHAAKLTDVKEDAEREKEAAHQKVLAERERSEINMDTLKNATAATVARAEKEKADALAEKDAEAAAAVEKARKSVENIRKETAERITANEAEVAEKLAEGERRIEQNQILMRDTIDASQRMADDKVASITSREEKSRANLLESTQKQIDEADAEARRKVARAEAEMAEREAAHRSDVSELKGAHAERVKEMEEDAERRVREVHDQMEQSIAKGEEKLSAEKERHAEEIKQMEETMERAKAAAEDKLAGERSDRANQVREMEDAAANEAREQLDERKKEKSSADAKLAAEEERYAKIRGELLEFKAASGEERRRLDGDVQLLRTNSFRLERVSATARRFSYCLPLGSHEKPRAYRWAKRSEWIVTTLTRHEAGQRGVANRDFCATRCETNLVEIARPWARNKWHTLPHGRGTEWTGVWSCARRV